MRQLPAISVHLPVTPQNRSRLRALRQAELAAWNAAAEAGFDTADGRRREAVEKERRDLRAFGLVAIMAVATVMISLSKTSYFAEGWTSLVHLVRHWIG